MGRDWSSWTTTTPTRGAPTRRRPRTRGRGAADADKASVLLSPTDETGEPRTRVATLGEGRYAAREDPRVAAARDARRAPKTPWARLRDLVLHQLDENFLLHAHHVSPFAHSMDAYETEVATRNVRSMSLPPHACGRKERPVKALKKRAPFLAVAGVAFHRMFKWRKAIKLVRPRYLVMSFLFVGWTGGWSAGLLDKIPHASVTEKHPLDDDDADDGDDDFDGTLAHPY